MPHEIEFFPINPTEQYLYKCSKCKCKVSGDDIEEHRVFHAEIDELIEWAQSVSKLFTPGVPDESKG